MSAKYYSSFDTAELMRGSGLKENLWENNSRPIEVSVNITVRLNVALFQNNDIIFQFDINIISSL